MAKRKLDKMVEETASPMEARGPSQLESGMNKI